MDTKKSLFAKLAIFLTLTALGFIPLNSNAAQNKDTITLLSSSSTTAQLDQTVTFSASVSVTSGGGTPTGSISFTSNGSQIGTCTLASGACSTTHAWSTGLGTYSILAIYTPSGNFNTSTSSAVSQLITVRSTSATVDSNNSPAIIGQPIVHTVRVISTAGTGPAITGTAILHA